MARRATVRYWPSRSAYCCWFRGKQHVLAEGPDDFPGGATYQQALQRFAALTALQSAHTARDANTARVVCEKYLQWIETRRKPQTLKMRRRVYLPFTDRFGEVAVRDLTQAAVYDWLDDMRRWRTHPGTGHPTRWTDGSVRNAISGLQAAFNWAARSGLIGANPLAGMERPEARSRGREALLGATPAERAENHAKVLAAATRAFRPFVVCLHATGCRPGELAAATAADFRPALGAIVYHAEDKRLEGEFSHKTSRKGKERVILLTGEALAVVTALAAKHPTGLLFRTGMGRRVHKHLGRSGWTDREVGLRFRTFREAVGIPRLTAYSYRHTFATAWLEQGRSVDILAELMGNSPLVIRKHYSHLLGDTANLRRQLEAFTAAGGTGSPPPAGG